MKYTCAKREEATPSFFRFIPVLTVQNFNRRIRFYTHIFKKMSGLTANEERPASNSGYPETEKGLLNGDKPSGGVKLKRDVGLIGGIAVIVGTMIGSGIFASPKGVLEASGSVGMALIVWALCGVLAVCGAMSYAELGTMIPNSGGEYVYLRESFGALPSFLYAWTACIVIKPSQVAIICLIFGEYIVTPFFPDCTARSDVQTIVKLLAALAIGKYIFPLFHLSYLLIS